jgi:hypothetical protein
VAQATRPTPGTGQVNFGEYPWQAGENKIIKIMMMLKMNPNPNFLVLLSASDSSYQGSGVLIDHLHILTVAHKVSSFA